MTKNKALELAKEHNRESEVKTDFNNLFNLGYEYNRALELALYINGISKEEIEGVKNEK